MGGYFPFSLSSHAKYVNSVPNFESSLRNSKVHNEFTNQIVKFMPIRNVHPIRNVFYTNLLVNFIVFF